VEAHALRSFRSRSRRRSPRRPLFLSPKQRQAYLPVCKYTGRVTSCLADDIRCALRSSAQSRRQPPSGETTVRSSSADASASARPFATLQNLASLVPFPSPFSWSSVRTSSESPSTSETNNNKADEQKKGFVSKERQLARLRQRMAAEEGVVVVEPQTCVQQQEASVVPCRRCVYRVVSP